VGGDFEADRIYAPHPDGSAILGAAASRRAAQFERRAQLRVLFGLDARACRCRRAGCDCLTQGLVALDDRPELRKLGSPGLCAGACHVHARRRREFDCAKRAR
jgi:hypothetical protein